MRRILYRIKLYLIIFIVTSTNLFLSCNDTLVGPPEDIPGSRDYIWTVDTLNYPYNHIYRIWGSSPTDVWATSPGGDLDKTIFHFDGKKWKTDSVSRPLSPHSIFGFSPDNIFIGGSDGMIWHYDGNIWKQLTVLTKDGNDDIVFDNMWGESFNSLYAFGAYTDNKGLANNSVIAHFENSRWTMLNTSRLKGIVEHFYKNSTDDLFYLQVIKFGGTEHFDSSLIYQYYGEKFKQLYSSVYSKGQIANISLINKEVYFILGNEIAKRSNNEFIKVFQIDNQNFEQRIWGRSSKDIFLFMTNGLAHYNGKDIQYMFYFNKPRTRIFQASIFENEVFFIVYESSTNLNLIYHGKKEKIM